MSQGPYFRLNQMVWVKCMRFRFWLVCKLSNVSIKKPFSFTFCFKSNSIWNKDLFNKCLHRTGKRKKIKNSRRKKSKRKLAALFYSWFVKRLSLIHNLRSYTKEMEKKLCGLLLEFTSMNLCHQLNIGIYLMRSSCANLCYFYSVLWSIRSLICWRHI